MTVQYESGSYTFVGQILVTSLDAKPFAGAGDSGSLIVERGTNMAVGLLFAGSPSYALANHITDVLAALNVKLA
jgi:hypothetical protein